MMRPYILLLMFVVGLMPAKAMEPTGDGIELMMVEQAGCVWCARWDKEIGPVYPKTDEGKRAPLRRFDKHDPLPEKIHVARGFIYTPTFVLLVDGTEKGRIEGYPGEDFFWGLLEQLLTSVDKAVSTQANK